MELLESQHVAGRIAAAGALLQITGDKKRTLPILLEHLQHEDRFIRETAAWALARAGSNARDAAGTLAKVLTDPSRSVRVAAATALVRVAGPNQTAFAVLRDVLKQRALPHDHSMALAAIESLGAYARELVPAVRALTEDRSAFTRRAAMKTLERIETTASKAK